MKILVIRLKYIGDALLSLPVIRSIKQNYPDAEIDYLLYDHIACLFDGEPSIRKVQVITQTEKKSPEKYFKKLLQLRAEKYDVVVDLLAVPVTVMISRFVGAKRVIGFDKGKKRARLYSHKIKHVQNVSSVKQKLALLKHMPFPIQNFNHDITLQFDDLECEKIRQRMARAGLDFSRPIFLFSCIARVQQKLWPEQNYVELINKVQSFTGAQVLLAWGNQDERQHVTKIAEQVQNKKDIFYNVESKTIRELAIIAKHCNMYIGNDSGPRHIAEAAGIPTFTIFAPSYSKKVWIPELNQKHQAIDLQDVLQIDWCDYMLGLEEYSRNSNKYFNLFTPNVVYSSLSPMLEKFVK